MKKCDHTSVGVLVYNNRGKLLMIKRRKYPPGYACPAGHVDDHGGWVQAAEDEVKEEVGIRVSNLELILDKTFDNPCRRDGGDHHHWKVYTTIVDNPRVIPAKAEVADYLWVRPDQLHLIPPPGIEMVWRDILHELGML